MNVLLVTTPRSMAPTIPPSTTERVSCYTCYLTSNVEIIVYDLHLREFELILSRCFSEDIPLGQVKISELPGWLARRSWTPAGIARGMSRGYWRWNHAFLQPKRAGMAGFIHWCVGICFVSYMASYGKFRKFLSTFHKNDFT